ncbi:MAG: polysaccharide deacetylase family protein [Lentisphaerae bacterium]|nr:polysaccharide deacetylase family protein [Lentisphaerota bacterium]
MKTVILSFDVDGERAFGAREKLTRDRFLETGIPAVVDYLGRQGLDATFFVVGRNILDFPELHAKLRPFEIGNHTHSHLHFLTSRTRAEKQVEVGEAHRIIKEFYGSDPVMFRAPDYQIDEELFRMVMDMGYAGDSSLIRVLLPPRFFFNYLKQRKLAKEPREFPLTSCVIPFNGTSIISLGLRYAEAVLERVSRSRDVLVLNFHPRDFTHAKIEAFGYLRRDKAVETTTRFLDSLRGKFRILSFRQFFELSRQDSDFSGGVGRERSVQREVRT